jgi:hypothetical protein
MAAAVEIAVNGICWAGFMALVVAGYAGYAWARRARRAKSEAPRAIQADPGTAERTADGGRPTAA